MTKFILAHLDWLSSTITLFGYWRLSKKKLDGWIWSLTGNSILVIWGIPQAAYGLVLGNIAYIILKIYAHWKWRKDHNKETINT